MFYEQADDPNYRNLIGKLLFCFDFVFKYNRKRVGTVC